MLKIYHFITDNYIFTLINEKKKSEIKSLFTSNKIEKNNITTEFEVKGRTQYEFNFEDQLIATHITF